MPEVAGLIIRIVDYFAGLVDYISTLSRGSGTALSGDPSGRLPDEGPPPLEAVPGRLTAAAPDTTRSRFSECVEKMRKDSKSWSTCLMPRAPCRPRPRPNRLSEVAADAAVSSLIVLEPRVPRRSALKDCITSNLYAREED
jgi:hypothetical protein